MPGHEIAHYQILAKLGAGGMGVVYLAQDARLGRRVALKVLPTEFAGDEDRIARFEREARAVAALSHPESPFCTRSARRTPFAIWRWNMWRAGAAAYERGGVADRLVDYPPRHRRRASMQCLLIPQQEIGPVRVNLASRSANEPLQKQLRAAFSAGRTGDFLRS